MEASNQDNRINTPAPSGDPFYVFKDELESKVSTVHQKYTKWKSVYESKDLVGIQDLPKLTTDITNSVMTADKSLKFLEQTITMVEANRSKFEHIDNNEIASRKEFVATIRKDLSAISNEITSSSVQARVKKEEQRQLRAISSKRIEDNDTFFENETHQQSVLMTQQDESLAGLHKSVTTLNTVAVEINHEINTQNKMLDDLSREVDETQEQLNFVMGHLGKFLKTKDKRQLKVIILLILILIVMIFLVIYT